MSLADLNKDEEQSFRKIKLRIDEVQGKNCLTNFHGMDFTSDKLRSLVRKWQTLIEAHVDVKTTDGYLLRLFAIGFTKRRPTQVRKTTYAQSSQVREIRKRMFEIMTREATSCDLKELVQKFVPEAIGREIEKASRSIYPLQNVYVRKAKILKAPKFDVSKLLELHGESTDVCILVDPAHAAALTMLALYRRQVHGSPRISRSRKFWSQFRTLIVDVSTCTAICLCSTALCYKGMSIYAS